MSKDSAPSQEQQATASVTAQNVRDAAFNGNIEQVRKAIQQEIDINEADQAGRTALMLASFNGHTQIVQLLLKNGATIDDRNTDGRTALIFAASGPFADTVKLLLENEADPNATDSVDGWSALMFAAAEGHQEVVQALLEANADPALQDKEGDTAIDFAQNNNHPEVANLLKKEAN
ncbi:ankyrin repeat domain-containing protein [Fodinibius salsisoli]|uniref:Ankyrin repeat domain-containing protein n=1 Tax=Fodinibius salsisoli TaxID=2820877 RepID=A0ABT3PMR7_9BACT|nr:ankyrin repeat domain-containing protein [Fodinibius salsisoli]MCW9707235.1 ankyrin repeat domain-containing protein [Fodinibius salsisoli]